MTEYEISNEIMEIGCMCDKCNCAMKSTSSDINM